MNRKKILVLVTFVFAFLFNSNVSYASLPEGIGIGDELGNKVDGNGNFFIENNDIKPGDEFSRSIIIYNYPPDADKSKTYKILMSMNPVEKSGDVDLFKNVSLNLNYAGNDLYNGNIVGEATSGEIYQENSLYLVTVEPGQSKTVIAKFNVANNLPIDSWKGISWADFSWKFTALGDEVPIPSSSVPNSSVPVSDSQVPTSSKTSSSELMRLPQTGEEWAVTLLGLAVGIIVITFVLVIVKKMRDNKEE